jgi:hypothetical protein
MKRSTFFALTCLLLVLFSTTSSTVAQETYSVTADSARVRAEPDTKSQLIATLRRNTHITALETVEGTSVSGSRLWYRIEVDGQTGYIHSSLVRQDTASRNADSPVFCDGRTCSDMANCNQAKACLAAGYDNLDRDNDGVPCESICSSGTVFRSADTSGSCGGATKCDQMTSCEQARACLAAGLRRLDGDNDGVPCESICSGG